MVLLRAWLIFVIIFAFEAAMAQFFNPLQIFLFIIVNRIVFFF